ncbi:MAG: choice-of-anchor Q domain-containing protein [Usitatibacteraceae bacterium]
MSKDSIAARLVALICLGLSSAFATSAIANPAILFTDVESGPLTGGPGGLGVPISIFGKGFGVSRGDSKVTIGGVEVAAYNTWGANNANNQTLDMIVVQPGSNVLGGAIEVTVAGRTSNRDFLFAVNGGKIRYVATNGADSNVCSEASPCATILNVVSPNITGPGDAILVRGGTYAEGEMWIRNVNGNGGTLGHQKTIKNYPNEIPVFSNGARGTIVEADYMTFSGLRFTDGKSIGVAETGNTSRIVGDRFINLRADGAVAWAFIDTHGDDHTLAGNVCEASSSVVGTQGHCYYVSFGNNLKLLYNIGSGAPGYGLHIFDQRRQANDFRRMITNVLVEGNILKNSKQRSGLILAMGDEDGIGNRIQNVVIRNNIFTGNNHLGIALGGNISDIQIYNNTFYQNGRQDLLLPESGTLANIVVKNNLFYHSPNANCLIDCSWYQDAHVGYTPSVVQGLVLNNNGYFPGAPVILNGVGSNQINLGAAGDAGGVTGPITFVDPAIFDFRVLAGSANIDRGIDLTPAVARDYNGISRPQGSASDLGAFELDQGTIVLQSLTGVYSRKAHAAAGNFDIPIDVSQPLTGNVTTEPRTTGGMHSIVFVFSAAVAGSPIANVVDATGALIGAPVTAVFGNELHVLLSNVPDRVRATVSIGGLNDIGAVAASMGFLIGDVDNTRTVNASDISGVKARSGQTTNANNFRYDVNASGSINSSDISAVKSRSGFSLP